MSSLRAVVPAQVGPPKLRRKLKARVAYPTSLPFGQKMLEQDPSVSAKTTGLRSVALTATVLVPTHRRPRDLERCLAALQRQTELPDEVLVVVREGDDETFRLLSGIVTEEMRLRALTVTKPGQVAALNRGLAEARGEIVAILDDDAAPHPEWVARIRRHFEADPIIGGVGGRDRIFRDGELWAGQARVVGRVQWFGRVIGNHHLGSGEPQDVDTLKGANMSFRRQAIEGLRFDPRLRGQGAQVHNDLAFCLGVKRGGWRLVYDPAVSVDHFLAPRHDLDQRNSFNPSAMADAAHNQTLTLLEHLSAGKRIIFVAWSIAVGTRSIPGIAQLPRLALEGDVFAAARLRASLRGRREAWATWRRSRRLLPT